MIRSGQNTGGSKGLGGMRSSMIGTGSRNLFGHVQRRSNNRMGFWSSRKIRVFWQSLISLVLLGAVIGIFSWSGQYAQRAQRVIREYVIQDYGMTPVFNVMESVVTWGDSLEQPIEPEMPAAASLSLPADGQVAEDSAVEGMWIETVAGAKIRAVMSGTITAQGHSAQEGIWCELDSQTGWRFLYSHCGALSVKEGDQVKQGDILGLVEDTAEKTGRTFIQVFYENQAVNPVSFFIGQS